MQGISLGFCSVTFIGYENFVVPALVVLAMQSGHRTRHEKMQM